MIPGENIAVAMSGGVDSLWTAALLKERGHKVVGVHMRLLPAGEGSQTGAGTEAREELVLRLASELDVPLTVVDVHRAFEERVIGPFLKAYMDGITPNPCVLCNPRIKFELLWESASRLGARKLATGHYVRLLPPDASSGRFRLHRADDAGKDQSYFLFGLSQEQLSRACFPLGDMSKEDARRWARSWGLDSLLEEESQEICFIPSGDYRGFLRERLRIPELFTGGPIVDKRGRTLGRHRGVFNYTIGQRRGLGIASTAPYYVVELRPASGTVVVGRAEDLYSTACRVERVNWVSLTPPPRGGRLRARVRIRNQHKPAGACIEVRGSGAVRVHFDEAQRAVTPGQAAVFYDDRVLLGGGIIAGTEQPQAG